jgi:hypothetical protein
MAKSLLFAKNIKEKRFKKHVRIVKSTSKLKFTIISRTIIDSFATIANKLIKTKELNAITKVATLKIRGS